MWIKFNSLNMKSDLVKMQIEFPVWVVQLITWDSNGVF